MRHDLELVRGVEGDHVARTPAPREERLQTPVGEDALDEVLPQWRVAQASFLFDRQFGIRGAQRAGEQADPVATNGSVRRGAAHALHPAARRVLLEDVAAQVERCELAYPTRREASEPRRTVDATARLAQAGTSVRSLVQLQRRPWDGHPRFDLGTHGNPLDVLGERAGQETVAFVPTVEANLAAEQAGRNAEPHHVVAHAALTCCRNAVGISAER